MQLQTLFAEVLPNNRLPAQQVTSVTCDSRQVQKGSVFVVFGELWATGTTMWRRRCKREQSLWWRSRTAKFPISCWWRTPVGCTASCRSVFWLPSQKDAAAGIDRHQWQDHQCLDAPPCAGSSGNQGGLDWNHLQPHRGIADSACALHHTRCLGASAAACHDV